MSFGEEHQKIVRYPLAKEEYWTNSEHATRWINDANTLAEQGWFVQQVIYQQPGAAAAGIANSNLKGLKNLETVVIYQRHPDWYEWAEKETTKKKAEEQAAKKVEAEFDDTVSDWQDE